MKVYHIPMSIWVAAENKSDAIKLVMSQMDWVIDDAIQDLFRTGECEGVIKAEREGGVTHDEFVEKSLLETWAPQEK